MLKSYLAKAVYVPSDQADYLRIVVVDGSDLDFVTLCVSVFLVFLLFSGVNTYVFDGGAWFVLVPLGIVVAFVVGGYLLRRRFQAFTLDEARWYFRMEKSNG